MRDGKKLNDLACPLSQIMLHCRKGEAFDNEVKSAE